MARHNRAAEAARSRKPARAKAPKSGGPRLSPEMEKLAKQVAAKGIHPIAVARRIIARMPAARAYEDAPRSGTWSSHKVRSGYNTDWIYELEKGDDGYAMHFYPEDIAARRASGEYRDLGGYIVPSVGGKYKISSRKAYSTQKAAREAATMHMGVGGYLLHHNPSAARRKGGASALPSRRRAVASFEDMGYEVARSLPDSVFGMSLATVKKRAHAAAPRKVPATKKAEFERGVASRFATMSRYFRSQSAAGDMPYPYYNNPSDWAIAYEGRLRDLTRASDGLIRVEDNPRGRRAKLKKRAKSMSARAAGLAHGQSLMAQAAAEFSKGKHPNMAAALKAVAKKHR